MKPIFFILILVVLTISLIIIKKRKEEDRIREEERQILQKFFRDRMELILQAYDLFTKYLTFQTGYFSNYTAEIWYANYVKLYYEIKNVSPYDISLTTSEIEAINKFKEYIINTHSLRVDFNQKFLKSELLQYDKYFDNIVKNKLDNQQREAVIVNEDNNLVIAGAGSGKTMTIVAKVNYLLDRYNVSLSNILLISFTKKSSESLAERVQVAGIQAKTFHKLGINIIAQIEKKKPSIFDDSKFKPLITRILTELSTDTNYTNLLNSYFLKYQKREKSQTEFETQGDYIQFIKEYNFKPYKQIPGTLNNKATYNREIVKSIEECKIANFLLFNSIDYDYELKYEHATADLTFMQYKPDFTIKNGKNKVYLEHCGVARNGDVPKFFIKEGETLKMATMRYWNKIEWARKLHDTKKTTLIESYSYEMQENILFENLTINLQNAGVTLIPKTPEEIWEIISTSAKEEVDGLIELIGTFITLMKSNNYTFDDLMAKNSLLIDQFNIEQNDIFLKIAMPIYERYNDYLRSIGEIDFSDMINNATHYVEKGMFEKKLEYIIVDEFQDISIGRYKLLQALKKQNPACKLFCVGDDWQSIYRFAGSDISLFKDFEKYFGVTVKSKIETTYRFSNPLIELSSNFIKKNPNQSEKQLQGLPNSIPTKYQIKYTSSILPNDGLIVFEILTELIENYDDIADKEILIVGRYSFDFNRLFDEDEKKMPLFKVDKVAQTLSITINNKHGIYQDVKLKFQTAHKSKGLEADIVIVINCNAGKHGFPSELSDSQVLNLLLSSADQYENGEERRLFYVAMTRAKNHVYFLSNRFNPSKFIREIETSEEDSTGIKCPNCKTAANIVLKKTGIAKSGNTYNFYGCTNYLYGCDYTTTEWKN